MSWRGVRLLSLVGAFLAVSANAADPGFSFAVGLDANGKSCVARRMFGDPKVRSSRDRAYEIYCGGNQEPVASLYLLQPEAAQAWLADNAKTCIDPHPISDGKAAGTAAATLCKGRGGPDEAQSLSSKMIVWRSGAEWTVAAEGPVQTAELITHATAIALGQESTAKVAAGGPRSGMLDKLSAALGEDVTVPQFDYQTLVAAGSQSNGLWLFGQAGRYYSSAIAAHRVQWPNDRAGDADLKLEYALNLSNERRAGEAARWFADAAKVADSTAYIAEKYAVYRAADALNRGDKAQAKSFIEQFRNQIDSKGSAGLTNQGERLGLLSALSWRVQAAVDGGDVGKVRGDLAKATEELERLPPSSALWVRSLIAKDIATLDMRENRLGEAVKLLQFELERLSHWATGSRIEGNLRIVLAQALAQQGDTDGAESAYRTAFAIFASQPENPGVSVDNAVPYIRFLMGRLEKADAPRREQIQAAIFAAYESIVSDGTARTATEVAARLAAGSNGALVREWQDAVRNYRRAQARFNAVSASAAPNDPARTALADELDALRKKADGLGRRIYSDVPGYDFVAYRPVGLAELKSRLKPGEVFSRIAIGADGGVGLLIGHDWARPYLIKDAAYDIATAVKRVKQAAAEKKLSQQWKAADIAATHQLFEALYGVVEIDLLAKENTRLVVDASGDLASLPLAVLSTKTVPAGTPLSDVPWLVKSLAVEVTPGTRAFLAESRAKASAPLHFVGFANATGLGPKRDDVTSQLAAVLAARRLAPSCQEAMANFVNQPALPGSEREVRAVAAVLHVEPKLFAGDGFHPSVMKTSGEVAGADVLMFATHGLKAPSSADSDTCVPPYALLTSAPTAAAPEDMLIDVPLVLDLNLNARVVVLAACSTGTPVPPNPGESGLPSGGDALSGMTRAFLYAGARSVIITHWKINDNNSVVTSVFRRMAEGDDSVAALRQAQLQALENPQTAAPFYWASFSTVGVTSF